MTTSSGAPKTGSQTTSGSSEPDETVVIIAADTGKVYKLKDGDWRRADFEVTDPDGLFYPNQVVRLGSYVAVPPALGTGIGLDCTIVNLKAILK